jgi:putative heme-binding domain-containing protein
MREFLTPAFFTLAALAYALPAYSQGDSAKSSSNPFHGNEQAIAEGRDIYNRSCTGCHGYDGASGDRAPALAAAGRRYQRTSDTDIFDAITKGIPNTGMPPSGLSEDVAWKATSFIVSLRGTAIDAPAKGDVAHGEQVFKGKGECTNCHMLRGKGGLLGPDLSNLADRRTVGAIRSSLSKDENHHVFDGGAHDAALAPLATYKSVRIVTSSGQTITGILKNEDDFSLQVLGTDNKLHLLSRARVKQVIYEPKSLMPTDYDKRLTSEEFQDLLAFLSRLGKSGNGHVARSEQP